MFGYLTNEAENIWETGSCDKRREREECVFRRIREWIRGQNMN